MQDNKPAKNSVTLTACMMVKNEEDLLPGCLESIKEMVDELIIVDTGSQDNTITIAKTYGAQLYHHPWENNFSKHRNQTIQYASGEWILIIDADERLIRDHDINKAQLIRTLSELPKERNALMLPMRDINSHGEVVTEYTNARLFRNTADFHYEGIVHNQPVFKGNTINISGISINHHGYHLSSDKMVKKYERTRNLLLKRIQLDPKDVEAYFYLTNHFLSSSQHSLSCYQNAIEYGQKCVQLLDQQPNAWPPPYLGLFYAIAKSYSQLDDKEMAIEWSSKGLQVIPDDPDLHSLMCKISIAQLNYTQTLDHGISYLNSLTKYRTQPQLARGRFVHSTNRTTEVSTQYLIMTAYLGLGEIKNAENIWPTVKENVLSNRKLQIEYLRNLAAAGDSNNLIRRTILFLDSSDEGMDIAEPLIDYAIGNETFTQIQKKLVKNLGVSQKALETICNIASLLIQRGYYSQAIELLEPYNKTLPPNSTINKLLAFSYEMTGDNLRAHSLYATCIKNEFDDPEFIIAAMNFFRQVNDDDSLKKTVSLLLQKQAHTDLDDDILLFLVEYYWNHSFYDSFLSTTIELLSRHLQCSLENLQNNIEIADGYSKLSVFFLETSGLDLSTQALHIAWLVTEDPKYLYEIGNLLYNSDHIRTALQYYQEALNRNYLTIEIIDKMWTIYRKLKNESGEALCQTLKQKLLSEPSIKTNS